MDAELLYAAGQTDIVAFRIFAKVPKYRGADNSLARPRRKQAKATEDFDFHISYL
jgi:hypothetical protein